MYTYMKVAVVQHTICENQIEWNLQQITSLFDQQSGADLYVLAETFATGFMAEDATAHADVQGARILS